MGLAMELKIRLMYDPIENSLCAWSFLHDSLNMAFAFERSRGNTPRHKHIEHDESLSRKRPKPQMRKQDFLLNVSRWENWRKQLKDGRKQLGEASAHKAVDSITEIEIERKLRRLFEG